MTELEWRYWMSRLYEWLKQPQGDNREEHFASLQPEERAYFIKAWIAHTKETDQEGMSGEEKAFFAPYEKQMNGFITLELQYHR
jgi:hypothetical protein